MAIKFTKRTSAPATNNKYYKHHTKGGVNECIVISGDSVLPNCVGYSWGRAYECWGVKPKLSKGNAEKWWGYNDGYKRGQTPKVGAIVCSSQGSVNSSNDGCGHVQFVEEVYADGSILISQSTYGGSRFSTATRKKGAYAPGTQTFQGFIYPPVEFKSEEATIKMLEVVTSVPVYTSADKASKRNTSEKSTNYAKGTYYVFKESNGMINISKTNGVAGGWMNPLDNVVNSTVATQYYKKYTGASNSIVDILKSLGVNTSFAYRTKIANKNGIKIYTGLGNQNSTLVNLAKQGKLIKV